MKGKAQWGGASEEQGCVRQWDIIVLLGELVIFAVITTVHEYLPRSEL